MSTKPESHGVNELADDQLDKVSGGYQEIMTGYAPGDPCPTCGAILVDDNFAFGGRKRSRCPNCNHFWFYGISVSFSAGDTCPFCGGTLESVEDMSYFFRCSGCGKTNTSPEFMFYDKPLG